MIERSDVRPLIALAGPTASGKTSLALAMAERFNGEIVSCDSVAVYRLMEIGTAKPSAQERARVPHHCLDLYWPDEACTAGDWARHARAAIADITVRGRLPIIAGGTGLYLRALLDGLAPSPPRDEALRERLRSTAARRGNPYLHRMLKRIDPVAAGTIHANDTPKVIRSLEVALKTRTPQSSQWMMGRDALHGFDVLRIGLAPPRAVLYERINARAAAMFERGLMEETAMLVARYADDCRALCALGYAQAREVLKGNATIKDAVAAAQQGHRNYAKRQMTWFRGEPQMQWLEGCGDESEIHQRALQLVQSHLTTQGLSGGGSASTQ